MRSWIAQLITPRSPTPTFALKGSPRFGALRIADHPTQPTADTSTDLLRECVDGRPVTRNMADRLSVVSVKHIETTLEPVTAESIDLLSIATVVVFEVAPCPVPMVSENCLPIEAPDIGGKDYREQKLNAVSSQRTLFDRGFGETGPARFRKAYRESAFGGGRAQRSSNLWELLFPLLKPPLDIDNPGTFELPDDLYAFQIEGVKRLIANKSFLLADEMGTGKTVMTTVALRILLHRGKIRRVLIICPKSVLGVWDSHLRDWAHTLSVTVVSGSRDRRQVDWRCPAHVYVASYDTLRSDVTKGRHETRSLLERAIDVARFDLILADEAHAIKNSSSARARAVLRLARKATYRWALTGTPIQNGLDDLRGVFAFVRPALFRHAHELTPAEASRRIEPYFLRRRKRDVFPDLPDKIRSDVWLDLDNDQQAEYDQALQRGRDEFRSGRKDFARKHIFALINELKRICNFAYGRADSPKLAALMEAIEEVDANGKKALVFSQYRENGVDKLRSPLKKYGAVALTGEDSLTQRASRISDFQNDPATKVFLATVQTMGVGVTLTAASYVFHFDHWWNPSLAWQAEDRAHRKGQCETVNVYSYWMHGTIEERIRAILDRKGLLHEEVIDALSKTDFERALTTDDLLEALDLDRDSVRLPESEQDRADPRSITSILARLSEIEPVHFEHVVMQVFKEALGYSNARVTGRSSDGGVDIDATRVVSGNHERIVVQCKRMEMVGPAIARELRGVVAADPRRPLGFLVTSGRLTKSCRHCCEKLQPVLRGIDGIELARMIQDKGLKIRGVTLE